MVISKIPVGMDETSQHFKNTTGRPKTDFFRELEKDPDYHKIKARLMKNGDNR